MSRIAKILVLLLAIALMVAPVSASATSYDPLLGDDPVPTSSGSDGGDDGGGKGDPGGLGDGLGVTDTDHSTWLESESALEKDLDDLSGLEDFIDLLLFTMQLTY